MTRKICYAHSPADRPRTEWEPMSDHEQAVAELCTKFLGRINPTFAPWGEILGRWHDLGKYSQEFQSYIQKSNAGETDLHIVDVAGRVDHSTAAAQHSLKMFEQRGLLLAYPFAGHHAGLPDWDDGVSSAGLKQRLQKDISEFGSIAPGNLLAITFPGMPKFKKVDSHEFDAASFRVAFWIRMVFSGLVDADFLATEAFMSPHRSSDRTKNTISMELLSETLERSVTQLQTSAPITKINSIRESIGEACLQKAGLSPGLFSLCVPTGGGKTIASLRFALRHASHHKLDRVIVAIPFTSIIEQNARVYQQIFRDLGNDVVLEHHSNLDPIKETATNRLQSENWEAPLIVTTNVQFFESLFASRTSRCRKLHRIARSVIILDEAQMLPIELLKPTLYAIRELVDSYDCTVVLCSATQPALNFREDFSVGLKGIRPIIDDPIQLHMKLRRTEVKYLGKITDEELTSRLGENEQVLCILNTRPNAAAVFESLPNDAGNFHLSTRMCSAHRTHVLDKEIRPRLKNGLPCRVISTQLIEAGVDIDFPCVYRAITGLDSLAQAAGRCNREGIAETGTVYFFDSEKLPPVGMLRQAADTAKELLGEHDDLLSPETIEEYFRLHYWKKSDVWDRFGVLDAFGNQPSKMQFNFRQADSRYQFIPDAPESIIVPWNSEGTRLVNLLENPHAKIETATWRLLQRYSIQVRDHEFRKLLAVAAIEIRHDRWVLTQTHLYDEKVGLKLEKADGVLPVEDLMC